VTDGGEDIMQRHASGLVVEDVTGGDRNEVVLVGDGAKLFKSPVVVDAFVEADHQVSSVAEEFAVSIVLMSGGTKVTFCKRGDCVWCLMFGIAAMPLVAGMGWIEVRHPRDIAGKKWNHASDESIVMVGDVVKAQPAFAFGCASSSDGQKCGKSGVGRAVAGPQDDRKAVVEDDFRADDQFEVMGGLVFSVQRFLDVADGSVGANDAGECVFIGDGQGGVAQLNGRGDQFVRVGSAGEEGEVCFAMKF